MQCFPGPALPPRLCARLRAGLLQQAGACGRRGRLHQRQAVVPANGSGANRRGRDGHGGGGARGGQPPAAEGLGQLLQGRPGAQPPGLLGGLVHRHLPAGQGLGQHGADTARQ